MVLSPSTDISVVAVINAEGQYGRGVYRGILSYALQRPSWHVVRDFRSGTSHNWSVHRYDAGLIVVRDLALAHRIAAACKVVVNAAGSLQAGPFPTVCADDRRIGIMAADYLLARGFRSVGFVGQPPVGFPSLRLEGYRQRLAEVGVQPVEYEWPMRSADTVDWERHWCALRQWLGGLPAPTGVFANNDEIAVTVVSQCAEAGRVVPDDIAVLGVDNDDLLCFACRPPLSSIDLAARRIGYRAAELLDALMRGEPPPAEPIRVLPVRVVSRRSTETFAVGDPVVAEAMRIIRDQACAPLDVADLARQLAVGRRTLERRFDAAMRCSPHQEILRTRVRHAQRLLLETDLKTAEIARQCGFRHLQNFGEFFRRIAGTSPAAYRRAARST